jgi:hypothetical protein
MVAFYWEEGLTREDKTDVLRYDVLFFSLKLSQYSN